MVRGRERLGGREILLGAVCWIAYFSIYLGRLNFSAGMSEMLQTGLWEKGQLGSVAAAFYLAYGIGQYPSGLLGDRIPARWMVGTGLLGSALVNILFPAAGTVSGMRGMWFVNGLLQAMIWPPMVRLVTSQVNAGCSVKIILLLSFSSPAGMLCTYLVNAVILQTGSWEWCFLSAGIWLTGVAALWFVLTAAVERTVSPREKEPRQRDAPYKQNKRKRTAAVSSGLLCLTMAAFLHGILKDGLTTWIPTYLTEKFALASSFSALLAMALPVVNLCGIPVAQTANRHLFQNEAVVGAICYLLSLGGFLCMLGGGWELSVWYGDSFCHGDQHDGGGQYRIGQSSAAAFRKRGEGRHGIGYDECRNLSGQCGSQCPVRLYDGIRRMDGYSDCMVCLCGSRRVVLYWGN